MYSVFSKFISYNIKTIVRKVSISNSVSVILFYLFWPNLMQISIMCLAVWHINRCYIYITLINIEGLWILKPTDSNDMIEFFPPT